MARKIKRARSTHLAWAIEPREVGQPDFRPTSERHLFPHCWRNRFMARDALARFKLPGWETKRARVVRVAITVTMIGRG